MIENTFVIPLIRGDFIERCLLTLYKFTPSTFRVIVIDQTKDGIYERIKEKTHLYLRPHRNLGFAKAMNEGMVHAYRWNSKYITCCNDDVEFINSKWWSGILETFEKYGDNVMAVNPMSPKEPGWGYGLEHGKYIELLSYRPEYSEEDYQYLLKGDFSAIPNLPPSFPKQKTGVIDAIAIWCATFKRESIDKIGYFDERFYPGGGEDYDMDARGYRQDYRLLGTTWSWVYHHWGSSKDKIVEASQQSLPIESEKYSLAHLDIIWDPKMNEGKKMDPWGKRTLPDGSKIPLIRDTEVAVVDI